MEILFENAAAADLTVYTRELAARMDLADGYGPSLASFLPNRTVRGFKSRTTKVSRTTAMARVRGFDARTPVGKRPVAITQSEVGLAPLGQKLPIRELEILTKAYQDSEWSDVVDAIYDDMATNAAAIHNLMEKFRADFLFTGIVSINDNGFIQEADFGLDASHNLATGDLAALWSDPTADLIGMELEWVQTVEADSEETVTKALTSRRVVNLMLASDQYKTSGGADAPINYSLTALNATRQAAGLPPVEIYDKKVGGTRLTPDNKFVLATDTVGETQWGDTAEALKLFGSNAIDEAATDAPAIASAAWVTEEPVNIWSKSNATGLPVAGDINGLFVAEVVAA